MCGEKSLINTGNKLLTVGDVREAIKSCDDSMPVRFKELNRDTGLFSTKPLHFVEVGGIVFLVMERVSQRRLSDYE